MSSREGDEPSARHMLGRGSAWFSEAKRTLVDKATEFGEVEQLWQSMERESSEMESTLRRESPEAYTAWRGLIEGTVDYLYSMEPGDPRTFWNKPVIEVAVFTGTATSGSPIVSTSYPLTRTDQWAELQADLGRFSQRRNDQERVSDLLSQLSPRLRDQFGQAWETWYSATKDRRTPAMYGMRDAVQHAVVHLSKPAGRFRAKVVADSRKARMLWIARNLVSDNSAQRLLAARADWYPRVYSQLSDAHKAHFDEGAAYALLLEAQSFLLELLSTLDWDLVKRHRLCQGAT